MNTKSIMNATTVALRRFLLIALPVCFVFAVACGPKAPLSPDAAGFSVALADTDIWDGGRVKPSQKCQKYGGSGETPRWRISGMPEGADAVVFIYSYRNTSRTKIGGLGEIGYTVPTDAGEEFVVPAVPGHTFDLPSDFFMIKAHVNPSWDKAGAYLPPCSPGKRTTYYAFVRAARMIPGEENKYDTLAERKVVYGTLP